MSAGESEETRLLWGAGVGLGH